MQGLLQADLGLASHGIEIDTRRAPRLEIAVTAENAITAAGADDQNAAASLARLVDDGHGS